MVKRASEGVVGADLRTLGSEQLFGGCEDRDGLPGPGDF